MGVTSSHFTGFTSFTNGMLVGFTFTASKSLLQLVQGLSPSVVPGRALQSAAHWFIAGRGGREGEGEGEGGREGGKEGRRGGREGGRGGREGEREGGREGRREGGEGGRERGREGGREGGKEGRRGGGEEGRVGGREGGRERVHVHVHVVHVSFSPALTSVLPPTPPLLSRPHSNSFVLPFDTL